jgi:beta-ribofuranosylaminobenzene 5'-phosphate synthase
VQGTAGISRHAVTAPTDVRVIAPARLHFGFVDLHGGLGRCFGSLGMAVDRPVVRVRARRSERTEIIGPSAQSVERALFVARDLAGIDAKVRIDVEETIPPHAGLGSGTQIALACAQAVCTLLGVEVPVPELARRLERGARSGIGSAAFEMGGFIVDGGRGKLDSPPPVISRLPFPEEWRVLLLFDPAMTGLHGERESAAFRGLPRFPQQSAERLARSVLMQLLPSLAERRLREFGAALTDLQSAIGDHFAVAQGGRYASARVAQALQYLAQSGVTAYGQSSWGPTGFAILENQSAAEATFEALRKQSIEGMTVQIVRGCNHGAQSQLAFAGAGQVVAA